MGNKPMEEEQLPPLDIADEEFERAENLPEHEWQSRYEHRVPVEIVAAQFCRERQIRQLQAELSNVKAEIAVAQKLLYGHPSLNGYSSREESLKWREEAYEFATKHMPSKPQASSAPEGEVKG